MDTFNIIGSNIHSIDTFNSIGTVDRDRNIDSIDVINSIGTIDFIGDIDHIASIGKASRGARRRFSRVSILRRKLAMSPADVDVHGDVGAEWTP